DLRTDRIAPPTEISAPGQIGTAARNGTPFTVNLCFAEGRIQKPFRYRIAASVPAARLGMGMATSSEAPTPTCSRNTTQRRFMSACIEGQGFELPASALLAPVTAIT